MAGKIYKVARPSEEEILEKIKQAKEVRKRKTNTYLFEKQKGGINMQNDDSYYEKLEKSKKK